MIKMQQKWKSYSIPDLHEISLVKGFVSHRKKNMYVKK